MARPGAWAPGTSGNPRGRPPNGQDIASLARIYGRKGIERLAQLAALIPSEIAADNPAVQVAAIKELLDRGYGKAAQLVVGDEDRPVAIAFEWAPAAQQDPTPVLDAVTDALQVAWDSEGDKE